MFDWVLNTPGIHNSGVMIRLPEKIKYDMEKYPQILHRYCVKYKITSTKIHAQGQQ